MLSQIELKPFDDPFGTPGDTQSFYDDRAIVDLINHGQFDEAQNVLEFGLGTGRFAEMLLQDHLPITARYLAYDLSNTMVNLARQRLTAYKSRVEIFKTPCKLPVIKPHSVDRFVCNYVFNLMRPEEIKETLNWAKESLSREGMCTLVSLTNGAGGLSKMLSKAWNGLFKLSPTLVGGCRPIDLEPFLELGGWTILYSNRMSNFGVTTEVLTCQTNSSI